MRFFIFVLVLLLGSAVLALQVNLNSDLACQGKTLPIYVSPEASFDSVRGEFLGQTIDFYPAEGRFRGLAGIYPEQKPGRYDLKLVLSKERKMVQEVYRQIEIYPTPFKFTSFWLKPTKKKVFVPNIIQEEWTRIEKVLLVRDPEQRWGANFSLPAEGPFSMRFGTFEKINGKKRGQHRGLDVAVSSGTQIDAPEKGKVVFVSKLKAFGGTVVLDHGQGVHTLYFHLSKILKEAGEMVEKGEVIALSGNTGISSGPHLHWGMSVNNVRVDPLQWTKTEF